MGTFLFRGLKFDLVITGADSGFANAPEERKKSITDHTCQDMYIKESMQTYPMLRPMILLAKHWLQSSKCEGKWPSLRGPSSHFIELLCIEIVSCSPSLRELHKLFQIFLQKIVHSEGKCEVTAPWGE